MKKALAALTAVLLFGGTGLRADYDVGDLDEKSQEEFVNEKLEKLDDKLELTDEQESDIRAILNDKFEDMRNAKDDPEELRNIKEEKKAEIRGVLTDEQKAKYDRMKRDKDDDQRWPKTGVTSPDPKSVE
jgi:hypothetical protein